MSVLKINSKNIGRIFALSLLIPPNFGFDISGINLEDLPLIILFLLIDKTLFEKILISGFYKFNLIKEYLKGGFEHELKREIIAIAIDKKHLTYLECKHQFALGVLESSEYLNDNILGKFFDKDFA